ncbi:MAG: carbohydrate kinase family protein [Alphaproteobacteria bacterium]
MTDLICVGLTTLDILVRTVDALPDTQTPIIVDEITLAPAGTAGGTAMIGAVLGLQVSLISAVGQDVNGGITLQLLADHGVDCTHVARLDVLPTSSSVLAIRKDGERPAFHMVGASVLTALEGEAVAAAKQSRFLHFGGVGFPNLSSPQAVEALAAIRAAQTFITADLIAPQPGTLDILRTLLPHIDCFMPSEAEALALLGNVTMTEALQAFVDMGAGSCIIKRGGKGSIALHEGNVVETPAKDITPIDTTSCGDSFCAGFISGMADGLSFRQSIDVATETAAKVAMGLGTLGALEKKVAS